MKKNESFWKYVSFVTIALMAGLVFGVALTSCSTDSGGIVQNNRDGEASPASTDGLRSLQSSFRSIADEVLPSVVRIDIQARISTRGLIPFDRFGQPDEKEPNPREFESEGLGSGVVISRDGNRYYVLTNDHVVGEADDITIVLDDQTQFEAELVGRDPRKDLAMVSFTSRRNIPVARLGDSDSLRVGDWVVAIGSPFGYQNTVTVGIVSALDRSGRLINNVSDFIQTDAAINQGNSGGALVNLDGEVIGINTWITSQTGASAGLGFAIPINNVIRSVEAFLTGDDVQYGWLGVSILDPSPEQTEALELPGPQGAFVSGIFEDSPADTAGLEPGDFITAIDGEPITSADDLILTVGELSVGTRAKFEYIRESEQRSTTVTIEARRSQAGIQQLYRQLWPGFSTFPLTPEIAEDVGISVENGVIVGQVQASSPADIAGVQMGDVLTAINGQATNDLATFYEVISNDSLDEWEFDLVRNDEEITLTVVR
jgi:Do/DeqQ family serine protease